VNELTKEQQALNLLIQAADLAPLPGPQRRQWEEAAKVLMDYLDSQKKDEAKAKEE
jgi:hypothetical protein